MLHLYLPALNSCPFQLITFMVNFKLYNLQARVILEPTNLRFKDRCHFHDRAKSAIRKKSSNTRNLVLIVLIGCFNFNQSECLKAIIVSFSVEHFLFWIDPMTLFSTSFNSSFQDVIIKPRVQELYNKTFPVNKPDGKIVCKASGDPVPEIIWRKWSRK